mmetsp:Transcript_3126/g.7169  ORF Transcript_3126/g.7169 Transcript_3126/m.7169 type:complete len:190 (-) Transcript_3126:12-581(-)
MDTSFHYDLAEKNLNFKLRERLVARPGIELKGKGLFNTVTGNLSYAGTLRGVLKTRPEVKDEGSLPWKLGGGVHVASSADQPGLPVPQLHASVKKVVSLLDGPRTVLSSKAWVNVDPKAQKFTARKGSIKISHKWMGFTQRQDLKLSAGLDVSWPTKANEPTSTPFLQLRENNWALNYRNKHWFCTYDL